jgi:hypothetical protein
LLDIIDMLYNRIDLVELHIEIVLMIHKFYIKQYEFYSTIGITRLV